MSKGARTALALGLVLAIGLAFALWPAPEARAPVGVSAGSETASGSQRRAGSSTASGASGSGTGSGTGAGAGAETGAGSSGASASDPMLQAPDGGLPLAGPLDPRPPDPPPALHASEMPPERPLVRMERPPTPQQNLERAGRIYDFVVLRRDDVRRRIAELEPSGETPELARLRRELASLEVAARDARAGVERYAAEVGQAPEVGQAAEVGQAPPAAPE